MAAFQSGLMCFVMVQVRFHAWFRISFTWAAGVGTISIHDGAPDFARLEPGLPGRQLTSLTASRRIILSK
jgi:hypothetical protein